MEKITVELTHEELDVIEYLLSIEAGSHLVWNGSFWVSKGKRAKYWSDVAASALAKIEEVHESA